MALDGEYEPSPAKWVRDQVEAYERSGGREATTLADTDMAVVVLTTRGAKSGKIRKSPVMRVEHDGEYVVVASKGGAPTHPQWYHNLTADPSAVAFQDGGVRYDAQVVELQGDERALWWDRAVAAYPPYADYQEKTDRLIPVLRIDRRG